MWHMDYAVCSCAVSWVALCCFYSLNLAQIIFPVCISNCHMDINGNRQNFFQNSSLLTILMHGFVLVILSGVFMSKVETEPILMEFSILRVRFYAKCTAPSKQGTISELVGTYHTGL